jgi:hypothetical protein
MDGWATPPLKRIPLARLIKLSGMSRRALIYARVGRRRPHKENQETLISIVENWIKKNARPGKELVTIYALQESRR